MRTDMKRLTRELRRSSPKVCCECKSRFRPALPEEVEVIEATLAAGRWPSDVSVHELVGAIVCVSCGHVTVLTYGGSTAAVWCPGFGLHERVVASSN